MTLPPLGIDISNLKFDVALLREAGKLKHRVFPNSAAGFSRLSAWLGKQVGRARACLEATGAYSEALATTCTSGARRLGRQPRADQALRREPPLPRQDRRGRRHPHRPVLLGAVPARVEPLTAGGVRVTGAHPLTHRHAPRAPQAARPARLHPRHRRDDCGQDTRRDHGRETLRKRQAVSGLRRTPPRLHESGSRVKKRAKLSKVGAPRLRKALYSPAITAIEHNPYIKELGERLRRRGKCPIQVIGAAMRKLIHIACGVLKSGRPFDPEMKTA